MRETERVRLIIDVFVFEVADLSFRYASSRLWNELVEF